MTHLTRTLLVGTVALALTSLHPSVARAQEGEGQPADAAQQLLDRCAKALAGPRLAIKARGTGGKDGGDSPMTLQYGCATQIQGEQLATRLDVQGEGEGAPPGGTFGIRVIITGGQRHVSRAMGPRAMPPQTSQDDGATVARYRRMLVLGGMFFAARSAESGSDPKVSGLRMGKAEAGAEGSALQVVHYELAVDWLKKGNAKITLWIDGATNLPVKRKVVAPDDDQASITLHERYSDIATKGDAPKDAFDTNQPFTVSPPAQKDGKKEEAQPDTEKDKGAEKADERDATKDDE